MTWADLPRNPSAKILRQFAAAWLVFFGIIAARIYLHGHHLAGEIVGALAVVIGIGGLIKPSWVRRIFVGWMILAFPIGWLVSQLMLALMFYLILTPLALIFRLTGRDLLLRKRPQNKSSYWMPKPPPRDVRSYFRQY